MTIDTTLPAYKSGHLSHPKYRADIDGLRAIAVLSVVGFHAFPNWVKGGFIGVDIFFVLSGFLISTIIFDNLERDSFSFVEFYSRRIKRIFPALLLVLIASFTFGWFALLADEYKQLGKHIAAGAGFVSNFVFWNESGYFDNAAETKPLLHLWTLGIEEQFYIIWPLLLWAAWKRKFNLLTVTIVIAVVSFVLNIKGVHTGAVATFYSPQTRFWELLTGSILAYIKLYKQNIFSKYKQKLDLWLGVVTYVHTSEANGNTLRNVQSLLGAALISTGILIITKERHFPGSWALLPTLGAVLIISSGPQAWLNRTILSNRILVWFGLISFPLYLWHWPLLSFARIVESETPAREIRITAVFVSILLAWLTYILVEKPIRFGKYGNAKTIILLILIVIVGYVGYNTYKLDGLGFRALPQKYEMITKSSKWDYGNDTECNKKYLMSPCQVSGDTLKIMIIGDSHGNHLFPGIAKLTNTGIIAAGTCTPLLGIFLHVKNNQDDHPCARIDFLSKNLDLLKNNPGINTVILSSFWRPVLDGKLINKREREFWGGISLVSIYEHENKLTNQEKVYFGLSRTIEKIREYKRKIVFVRDPPDIADDFRDYCLKREKALFYSSSDCTISRNYVEFQRVNEDKLIEKLTKKFPELLILDPINTFCDEDNCFLMKKGKPFYRDQHHLSIYGSDIIGQELIKFLN